MLPLILLEFSPNKPHQNLAQTVIKTLLVKNINCKLNYVEFLGELIIADFIISFF